jgi:hypothetical protein
MKRGLVRQYNTVNWFTFRAVTRACQNPFRLPQRDYRGSLPPRYMSIIVEGREIGAPEGAYAVVIDTETGEIVNEKTNRYRKTNAMGRQ